MNEWYKISPAEAIQQLNTSPEGLRNDQVQELLAKHGKNEITSSKKKTRLSVLLSQFKDLMILILVIASLISFVLGDRIDAYVILAIIIGNALLGYFQEWNAENALQSLQKMAPQKAKVMRDHKEQEIDVADILPGDIILVEAGDVVPADARLVEVTALKVEEAVLTGESNAIEKIIEVIDQNIQVPADQKNMVFKGTQVSNGHAKAVVTATGINTEFGKIAAMLDKEEVRTPLQKRLIVFSRQLAVVIVVICLAVFGYGLLRDEPVREMFFIALSLAVAALPEALPAVVTITLASGAKRMADNKALIRHLPAVETLGSVTYICSDKTGTLTKNVMTVEKTNVSQGQDELFLHAMNLSNEVKTNEEGKITGDSTEVALVEYAKSKGVSRENSQQRLPIKSSIPFDSERMRMSTIHQDGDKLLLITKGAPAKMAEIAAQDQKKLSQEWIELNKQWASEGFRVLFFGYKHLNGEQAEYKPELESEIQLMGMVALLDPPREEVIDAIKECKTAGIKSVMITGDQRLTAEAIAKRLGLVEEGAVVMTGEDLSKLSDEQIKKEILKANVFARVTPEQKLKIISGLQDNRQFVAMTGDGVNDSPSLKQADIGIAMGITGTDVAKESADMILLDDNFATIVNAIKEGRRIYDNIRKFILYVLSCNLTEILTIFFAPVFGLAIPLLPIQILWINLVTDGLPGLALTKEPASDNVMNRPPRPPKEKIFTRTFIIRILGTAMIMTCAALLTQWLLARDGYDVPTQQTTIFTLLCFIQLVNALTVRTTRPSLFRKVYWTNAFLWFSIILTIALQMCLLYIPVVQNLFHTVPLDWKIMKLIILVAIACWVLLEGVKFILAALKIKV